MQTTPYISHTLPVVLSPADGFSFNWEDADVLSLKSVINAKQHGAVWAPTDMIQRHKKATWFPYLFCGEQGLVRYWHIGNKRNANAIVARTEEKNKAQRWDQSLHCLFHSFSVSLMGQLMVFTVSIINANKSLSPVCYYWTQMTKPY